MFFFVRIDWAAVHNVHSNMCQVIENLEVSSVLNGYMVHMVPRLHSPVFMFKRGAYCLDRGS